MWVLVSEELRLDAFAVSLGAVLLNHLFKGQLIGADFVVILRRVASTLVDQIKEEVEAVETVALAMTLIHLRWPSLQLF